MQESIEKSYNSKIGVRQAISRAQHKIQKSKIVTIEDENNENFERGRYSNSHDLDNSNDENFEFNTFINE